MASRSIPILTYHSIDKSGSFLSTPPALFRAQMRHLRQEGFRSLGLSDAARGIRSGTPFPEKSVVITFDDGYRNVYHNAFPVLQEAGLCATIFVIPGYCGKTNAWPGHRTPISGEPLASWAELAEMVGGGWSVGAHTVTHPDLCRISFEVAAGEILGSKLGIEDALGVEVAGFAYPYGRFTRQHRDFVAEHFFAACSVRLGKARLSSDPYSLQRIDSHYLRSRTIFRRLPGNMIDVYFWLWRLIRQVRGL